MYIIGYPVGSVLSGYKVVTYGLEIQMDQRRRKASQNKVLDVA